MSVNKTVIDKNISLLEIEKNNRMHNNCGNKLYVCREGTPYNSISAYELICED